MTSGTVRKAACMSANASGCRPLAVKKTIASDKLNMALKDYPLWLGGKLCYAGIKSYALISARSIGN